MSPNEAKRPGRSYALAFLADSGIFCLLETPSETADA